MNQKTKGQVDEEFIFYLIYLKPRQLVTLLTCPLNRPRQLVLFLLQHLIHIFAPVGINLQVEQTIHDAGRIKRPGITRDTVAV